MQTLAPVLDPKQRPKAAATHRTRVAPPRPGSEHPLLHLQRTVGNQAVLRILRATKRFGGPISPALSSAPGVPYPATVPMRPPGAPVLQTKLTVNKPGDQYEQEADRVAAHVMHMPKFLHAPPMPSTAHVSLQPKCTCGGACDSCQTNRSEETHDRQDLQRSPASQSQLVQATAPPIVEEVLRSPGRPLDPEARAFMEPRFGLHFGEVRIHTDSAADKSAESVNAQAYTVGNHVVFGASKYSVSTDPGKELLAHELTHVVQTGGGAVMNHPASDGERTAVQRAPKDVFKAADDSFESKAAGFDIVKLSDIQADVDRILNSPPTAETRQAERDFSANPRRAKATLYSSHFRNADERLSYAMGYLQAGYVGDPVSRNDLRAAMITVETQIRGRDAAMVVHSPPTRAEHQKLTQLVAARESDERQFYFGEVDRLRTERRLQECRQPGANCVGTGGTVDAYQQYIFAPAEVAFKAVVVDYGLPIASTLMDFVPVGGQLKVAIEGIWGKDLMTGRKLPGWERVLNIALVALPEAKGVFLAGKSGLTRLAGTALEQGLSAEETYNVTRGLSHLAAEDIEAAKDVAAGVRPNAAQRRVIRAADEMAGTTTAEATPEAMVDKGAAEGARAVVTGLEQLKRPIRIAGESHTLWIKRVGNKLTVWLCSPPPCAELAVRIEEMLTSLSRKHPARAELQALIDDVKINASWIDHDPALAPAEEELTRMQNKLDNIIKAHPDVENLAEKIADGPNRGSSDQVAPADEGPTTDKRGGKPQKAGEPTQDAPISQRQKPSVSTWKKWIERNLSNEKERDAFRQWLKKEHEGLSVHEHIFTEEEFIDVVRIFRAGQ